MENHNPYLESAKSNIIDLQKGKLPPQAIDVEEAIIGGLMIDTKSIEVVIETLKPEVFYKEENKVVYEAIFTLYTEKKAIDLLTVSNQLKKSGKLDLAGGDFRLIQLTQKISSTAHIEYHSKIILEKYTQRECIKIGSEIISESYEEDVDIFELIEVSYKKLGDVTSFLEVGQNRDFSLDVQHFMDEAGNRLSGVPSSLTKLNKKVNGWQDSELIILAARPGMGKTAFVLNEVLECGINGIPVALFSLEMSLRQIISRLLSIMSGIDNTRIRKFDLTHSEKVYLNECAKVLAKMPIIIDDTSGISPLELKLKCNRLKKDKGIKMIFVDYLQLMNIKHKKMENKTAETTEISKSLKGIAKDLDVPVMALSQLSRAVESRGASKRPMLSDLRDSGSIEQDADMVIFIYRPEYYKIDEWDDDERSPTYNTAEIDIAKFREGEIGATRVGCDLRYMRFMDIENIGQNIQDKYLKDTGVVVPEAMRTLPTIEPSIAFADYTLPKYDRDEKDDVPF